MNDLLDYLDARCVAISRRVAFIGVVGMLAVTALTTADVISRWLWGGSVPGLNEVLAMGLAFVVQAAARARLRSSCEPHRLQGRMG